MRTIFLFVLLLVLSLEGNGQLESRKEVKIPDIPGYLTLKGDFHIHTIFSDGLVWPTVRVEEAWREGLDVIALSDHIEYLPHEDDVRTKFGRAYEIAKPTAEMYLLYRQGRSHEVCLPAILIAFSSKTFPRLIHLISGMQSIMQLNRMHSLCGTIPDGRWRMKYQSGMMSIQGYTKKAT
jgi:hypothetical protein